MLVPDALDTRCAILVTNSPLFQIVAILFPRSNSPPTLIKVQHFIEIVLF